MFLPQCRRTNQRLAQILFAKQLAAERHAVQVPVARTEIQRVVATHDVPQDGIPRRKLPIDVLRRKVDAPDLTRRLQPFPSGGELLLRGTVVFENLQLHLQQVGRRLHVVAVAGRDVQLAVGDCRRSKHRIRRLDAPSACVPAVASTAQIAKPPSPKPK